MKKKEQFRHRMKENRASLTDNQREEKNQRIQERLLSLPLFYDAKKIFIFLNFRDEVRTEGIIQEALARGQRICLPKVVGKEMVAIEVFSLAHLVPNKMGIFEPEGDSVEDMDLIVCPGLAFDKKGYRMGYGGGYYDRFLTAHPCPTLGLGYDLQWVEEVPRESYDVAVDYFLSESYFFNCKKGKEEALCKG